MFFSTIQNVKLKYYNWLGIKTYYKIKYYFVIIGVWFIICILKCVTFDLKILTILVIRLAR